MSCGAGAGESGGAGGGEAGGTCGRGGVARGGTAAVQGHNWQVITHLSSGIPTSAMKLAGENLCVSSYWEKVILKIPEDELITVVLPQTPHTNLAHHTPTYLKSSNYAL